MDQGGVVHAVVCVAAGCVVGGTPVLLQPLPGAGM